VNDSRPLIMDLTETAAVVSRSIVALGSLAVPIRFRFGPNDGVPPIIGTGFVVGSTRRRDDGRPRRACVELAAEASRYG
jgi:hypothetical protein